MQIGAGNRIIQLLFFPYIKSKVAALEQNGEFGSPGKCVLAKDSQ